MRSDCPFKGIKKEPSRNLTQPCQGNEEGKAEGNVACVEPGLGLAWEVPVFEHERGKFGVEPKWQNGGGVGVRARGPHGNTRIHGNKSRKSHTRKCKCALPFQ